MYVDTRCGAMASDQAGWHGMDGFELSVLRGNGESHVSACTYSNGEASIESLEIPCTRDQNWTVLPISPMFQNSLNLFHSPRFPRARTSQPRLLPTLISPSNSTIAVLCCPVDRSFVVASCRRHSIPCHAIFSCLFHSNRATYHIE